MLKQEPGIQHAIISDNQSDPGSLLLVVAVRGKGTCQLRIPRDRYHGLALLKLIKQQTIGFITARDVNL